MDVHDRAPLPAGEPATAPEPTPTGGGVSETQPGPEARGDPTLLGPSDNSAYRIIGYDDGRPVVETADGTKVLLVPTDAFRAIKDKARDKGRGEAAMDFNAQMDEWAKTQGFDDAASLTAALKAHQAAPPAPVAVAAVPPAAAIVPPAAAPAPAEDPLDARRKARLVKTQGALIAESVRKKTLYDDEVKRRKGLEADVEHARFERGLIVTAMRAGVNDTDYALVLLQRHLASLDEKAVKEFDEAAWFGTLKKTHPAVFEIPAVPAETAPNGTAPPTPEAGDTLAGAGAGSRVDTKGMSAEEFSAYMTAKGYTRPGYGMPL